ncbi:hypothetical protein ACFFUB_00355 [Algimonas porphyrae]|uniref:hypothetical protein n=1 Tax=Algimonas porphyrae TaxID=1128113 RepID=UPI0024E0AEFC|nr:hypothetical protein [Algimonas porphyrae]
MTSSRNQGDASLLDWAERQALTAALQKARAERDVARKALRIAGRGQRLRARTRYQRATHSVLALELKINRLTGGAPCDRDRTTENPALDATCSAPVSPLPSSWPL